MRTTARAKKTKKGFSIYLDKYEKGERTYETIFKNVSAREKNRKLVEAEDMIAERLKIKDSGTVFELLKNYQKNYLQKDIRVINAVIKKFKKFMGNDILLSDLDNTHLKDFRYYLLEMANLKGETPSSYSIRFKKILQYFFDKGLISLERLNGFKLIYKYSNKPKEILTADEFNQLYSNLNWNDEIAKAFLFSCLTGLGLSEIKKLKKDNIREDKLSVIRCKTGVSINIQLCHKALKIINSTESSNHVFDLREKNTGKNMSSYKINKHIRLWLQSFNINKHITYYCARHTYCNFLFEKAYNSKNDFHGVFYVVSKGMGHNQMSSTTRYLNNYNKDVYSLTSSII